MKPSVSNFIFQTEISFTFNKGGFLYKFLIAFLCCLFVLERVGISREGKSTYRDSFLIMIPFSFRFSFRKESMKQIM